MELGHALSSEEHRPGDLVRFAREAEDSGFSFALISDHFHPWTDAQGQSPFVWSVIGAVAEGTERLRLGTPADVAEAIVCGPDPKRYRDAIDEFGEAGFDHLSISTRSAPTRRISSISHAASWRSQRIERLRFGPIQPGVAKFRGDCCDQA